MNQIVEDKLQSFFLKLKLVHFNKKEIIFRPDDEMHDVYYVKKGFIRMYSDFEDGKELTLNIYKPGTYFSMMHAISNINNSHYFQAMTPSDLHRASKGIVLEFIKENPDVLYDLTKRVAVGTISLLSNLEHLLSGSVDHRIISALNMLNSRFGEETKNGQIIIRLPLTHQIIATLAGITRESTTIALNKLVKKGLISYHKRILAIINIKKLREESKIIFEDEPQSYGL